MKELIYKLTLKYNISINLLATVTKISTVTMYRYSNNYEAESSKAVFLELLLNPINFYYVYNKNKDNIDKGNRKKIEDNLTILLADMKLTEIKSLKL